MIDKALYKIFETLDNLIGYIDNLFNKKKKRK